MKHIQILCPVREGMFYQNCFRLNDVTKISIYSRIILVYQCQYVCGCVRLFVSVCINIYIYFLHYITCRTVCQWYACKRPLIHFRPETVWVHGEFRSLNFRKIQYICFCRRRLVYSDFDTSLHAPLSLITLVYMVSYGGRTIGG